MGDGTSNESQSLCDPIDERRKLVRQKELSRVSKIFDKIFYSEHDEKKARREI